MLSDGNRTEIEKTADCEPCTQSFKIYRRKCSNPMPMGLQRRRCVLAKDRNALEERKALSLAEGRWDLMDTQKLRKKTTLHPSCSQSGLPQASPGNDQIQIFNFTGCLLEQSARARFSTQNPVGSPQLKQHNFWPSINEGHEKVWKGWMERIFASLVRFTPRVFVCLFCFCLLVLLLFVLLLFVLFCFFFRLLWMELFPWCAFVTGI